MKHIITLAIALVVFTGNTPAIAKSVTEKVSYATDIETGTTIELRSKNKKTIITELATGQNITIDGEIAGEISDEDYTSIMKKKRAATLKTRLQIGEAETAHAYTRCVSRFEVYGSTETPSCYLNSGSVDVTIRAISNRQHLVYFTLYKSIPFWFDSSHGTAKITARTSSSAPIKIFRWSSLSSGTYYFSISTSVWTYGYYSMQQKQ